MDVDPSPEDDRPMEPEPDLWAAPARPAEIIDLGDARLRRWTLDDVLPLYGAVITSIAHLRPWMPWIDDDYASDPMRPTEYLQRSVEQWADRTTFNYALVDASSGEILGSCGLMGRRGPGALEIGYWIHVDHVRRRLATRSAAALTEAGFALPEVGRIEIHHDVANVISGRVPARLGYVRLREEPALSEACGASGLHVVWAMDRDAWAASPGAALLADVRAGQLSPDRTR